MHIECFKCDLKHLNKLNISNNEKEKLKIKIINYLDKCDMSKTNPEIMADIWGIISNSINDNNPYKNIKNIIINILSLYCLIL